MLIGFDEKDKSLEEAISFNKDNFFEYIFFILGQRNANWAGSKSDEILKKIHQIVDDIPQLKDSSLDLEDLIVQALVETSEYAYKAGFKEACRLNKTLDSF